MLQNTCLFATQPLRFLLACLCLCMCLLPLASQGQTEGGTLRGDTFFEGSISFSVHLTGPKAEEIKELNDITSMVWHLKDANYIIQQLPSIESMQKPGTNAMQTVRLFVADSNQMYSMDLENRVAFKNEPYVKKGPRKPPVAEPLDDSLKILGHYCYAFRVVKPNQEETIYYVSPKYRMNTALFKGKTQARISFLTEGLDGYIPLKTIIRTKDYTTTITAKKVVPKPLDEKEFTVPPGFKIKLSDYRRG